MYLDVTKCSTNEQLSTVDKHNMLTDVMTISPDVRKTRRSSVSVRDINDVRIDYHNRQRYSRRPAVSIEEVMFDISHRLSAGKILQHRL